MPTPPSMAGQSQHDEQVMASGASTVAASSLQGTPLALHVSPPNSPHEEPLSTVPVISVHPSRTWRGIASEPSEFKPPPTPQSHHVDRREPSPVSKRSVSPRTSHSPPPIVAKRSSTMRCGARHTSQSLRQRPVVEITTRTKHKRFRVPSPLEESSSSDTEYEPSESDLDSDSNTEDGVEDEGSPRKRKRSSRSESSPPSKRKRESPSSASSSSSSSSKSATKASGSTRLSYTRRTDRNRHAFTTLHGDIRCIFCPIPSGGPKPRGTIHRLPDAAARHLREFCAHFEKSHVYQQHHGADPSLSRKDIVARLVRQYEKITVAQVHCRQNEDYKRRCAALGLSPANVESRLARHAVLYKIEDCECCPLPWYSKYLQSLGISQGSGSGRTKKPKSKVKQRSVSEDNTRAQDREVIEILDDDDDIARDEVVRKVKREDVETEQAGGQQEDVEISDERQTLKVQERDVPETQVKDEGVKEEIKEEEEEEEVVVREVHIKVPKSLCVPRVKSEAGVKREEGLKQESVKQEEAVPTVPKTRRRHARAKVEENEI